MRHFTLVESSRAFCSIPVFGQSKSSQDFEPAFCVKVLVRSECQAGVKLIRGLLGTLRRTAAYVHDPDSRTRFQRHCSEKARRTHPICCRELELLPVLAHSVAVYLFHTFICRGTACIYRNGPPQSFWGLFGWSSAGVEVQYLLQLFRNWVSVSMAWPLPLG